MNAIMLFRAAGLLKVISAVQPSGLFAHGPAKKTDFRAALGVIYLAL